MNKNTIPNDSEKPTVASGIRIGSAAMTSRGLKEDEFIILANLIDKVLRDPENENLLYVVKKEIAKLTNSFPIKRSHLVR